MPLILQIFLLVGVLCYLSIILLMLKRKRLNLQYTLVWFFSAAFLLIITFFPELVKTLSKAIGISLPSNFIFIAVGVFTLLIVLSLTSVISKLTNQTYRLTQNQALLEARIRHMEEHVDNG